MIKFIDGDGPLNGQQVVLEDLRQICLYEINNVTWWDYAIQFNDNCMLVSDLGNCSERIYKNLGFNKADVDRCIKSSFGNSDNIQNDNQVLAAERSLFLGEGIQIWPSIRINNVTYRVKLSLIL